MWQEAKRQERKIRGLLVDYRKRADRRRQYYERIKSEPTQFLQIHGRPCKIHLDQNVTSTDIIMVPWEGDTDNLIDRFDARAHLDLIPSFTSQVEENLTQEERLLNYERYRIIALNSFVGISEENCLKQLNMEEEFGCSASGSKIKKAGAAIRFNYENSYDVNAMVSKPIMEQTENSDSENDFDVDLAIDVTKLDSTQANEMNRHGCHFGMSSNDFYSFLINDLEEAEAFKLAKEEEQEKALFAGRKSRRERRYHREKMSKNKRICSPIYAAKSSEKKILTEEKRTSRSRSSSLDNCGGITFITSFGDDEAVPMTSKFSKSPNSTCKRSRSIETKRRGESKQRSSRHMQNLSEVPSSYRRRRNETRYRSRRRSISSRSKSSSESTSTSSGKSREHNYRRRKRRSSTSSSNSSSSSSRTSVSTSTSSSKTMHSPSNEKHSRKKSELTYSKQDLNIVPRYYGRKRSNSSSTSDNIPDDTQKNYSTINSSKNSYNNNHTIIDRLKRKRQVLLSRQLRADKIAARLKKQKEKLEEQIRADDLREMAIKLRRRQREKRHSYHYDSSNSESNSRSNSDESDTISTVKRRKYRNAEKIDNYGVNSDSSISKDAEDSRNVSKGGKFAKLVDY